MEQNDLLLENRDAFIKENKVYIYLTACAICRKKLSWENSDELSIALVAFNNACDTFSQNKGNFYSYAKVIIRNSLIDYFRKNSKTNYLCFSNDKSTLDFIDVKNSLSEFEIASENNQRKEEIIAFSKEISKFGIRFGELASSSPNHKDTRDNLLNIAFNCSKDEIILKNLKTKNTLPIKQIVFITKQKRKLIEKWRKYLIVLILLLSSSDYPYIKSYLNIKVGENA